MFKSELTPSELAIGIAILYGITLIFFAFISTCLVAIYRTLKKMLEIWRKKQ